jgi:hypothetical protein
MYQVTFLKPLTGTAADQVQFKSILAAKTLTPIGIAEAAHDLDGTPPGMFATGVQLAASVRGAPGRGRTRVGRSRPDADPRQPPSACACPLTSHPRHGG